MAERKYCKNTVAGSHPGQKWDAQTRAGVLADYLTDPKLCGNICAVARKHGVPESTIRGWLRAKGTQDKYQKAMEDAARDIALTATAAARNTVEYMRKVTEDEERMDAMPGKVTAQWAQVLAGIGAAGRPKDAPDREDAGGGVIALGERPKEPQEQAAVVLDGEGSAGA